MKLTRYITIQAILTKNKELIPIWDSRIKFVKTELYGDYIEIEGDHKQYDCITECIYDLKTKSISIGVEIDVFPNINDLNFKKGETVYVESSKRNELEETTIDDIQFLDFDLTIKKGKKIGSIYNKSIVINIEPNTLYAIKDWKAYYILRNGKKIESSFDFQLKRITKNTQPSTETTV